MPLFVYYRQLFHLVLHENALCILKSRTLRRGDEILFGHDTGNRLFVVGNETKIPIRDDADQTEFAINNGNS